MALRTAVKTAAGGRFPAGRALCLFAAAGLVLLFCAPSAQAVREKMSLRYLRSVYILRHLAPGNYWPEVSVPRQVRTHDTTSALLAHGDTAFVLESVSRDLTAALKTEKYPEAGYYAAQALSLQGRHAEAADAMIAYAAKAPFHERNYLFIVRALYAAKEYPRAIAQARDWELRGQGAENLCSEDRLTYIWGSLQAQTRYRDAMEEVLSDPCASWRGQVYFAKSSLDLGDAENAQARIDAVMAAFPDKFHEIERLWDLLSSGGRYP